MKEIKSALVIDQRFTGTASDLELLPWLFDVQFVKLEGPAITREVLALVAKMPKLNSLQIIETSLQSADIECLTDAPDLELLEILYTPIDDSSIDILERLPVFGDLQLFGTRLTAKGAIEVVDRIDTANVFVGRGGFLGITCEPSSLIIREVIPDGPAQLAGIRTLDKLVSVDGVAISNFEELRRELAKSASGEKVMVEYERPMVSFRRDPTSDAPGTRQVEYTPFRVEVTLGRRPSDVPR
jgi:C-terminal processing protease CtpA/Prc